MGTKQTIRQFCWPSPDQELLLETLTGARFGEAAWRTWSAANPLENLDGGSYRLLSLLYTKLQKQGLATANLARQKGIYRYVLCQNRLRLALLKKLKLQLSAIGVPFLVLKGMALTGLYYRDIGARSMDDLDILIPFSDKDRVVAHLESVGYRQEAIHHVHAKGVNLVSSHGVILDVHWDLSLDGLDASLTQACWDSRIPFQYEGFQGETLSSGMHLLHTITHGLVWNDLPSLRWVVDASMILRSSENPIDWGLFLKLTEQHRFSKTIGEGLAYLNRRFDIPVPSDVFHALQQIPISWFEAWEFRCKIAHPYSAPFAWRFVARLWRQSKGLAWHLKGTAFKKTLFGYLGTNSWPDVARQFSCRLARRYQQTNHFSKTSVT